MLLEAARTNRRQTGSGWAALPPPLEAARPLLRSPGGFAGHGRRNVLIYRRRQGWPRLWWRPEGGCGRGVEILEEGFENAFYTARLKHPHSSTDPARAR